MIDDDFDIGDVGEATFSALATDSSIMASPPKRDIFGWDYVLEFKNPKIRRLFWKKCKNL